MAEFRIFLFSPYCLLRPTTNRIYDMRLSDALAGQGAEVRVVYPYTYMKENIRQNEIRKNYSLKHGVTTHMLWTPLLENSAKSWRFVVMMLAFFFTSLRIAFSTLITGKPAVILSRDAKSLIPVLFLKKLFGKNLRVKTVFIAAEVKSSKLFTWVMKHTDGVLAGVSTARDAIRKIVPLDENRFTLSLSPVPVSDIQCSKEDARKEIKYASQQPLVVYTGKLGMDVNELRYIFEAAKLLPSYHFMFTGGRASAVEAVRNYCSANGIQNVSFTGFFNEAAYVRYFQLAADVLVSYYTSKDHMVEFNYPAKINEYMTTGNPVVTPDFPATRDVLNDRNVLFVKPDDPLALANGIQKLVEDKALAARLAEQARLDVQHLTFDAKAGELIRFLEQLPG